MAVQNNGFRINTAMVNAVPREIKRNGNLFNGNGYKVTSDMLNDVIEIGTVDFNSNVLSDDLKKKILENFKRRNTEYALSIKEMNKQKQNDVIRSGLREEK